MAASKFNQVEIPTSLDGALIVHYKTLNDSSPDKITSLLWGTYTSEEGNVWALPSVLQTEKLLAAEEWLARGYTPYLGYEPCVQAGLRLLLGHDSIALKEGRVTGIQALSAAGSLRMGAEFLNQIMNLKVVYYSDPTWGDHEFIFTRAGFESCRSYRYWDETKKALDFDGMMEDLANAPENSVIILQASAHNPTGFDPSRDQWIKIADIIEERGLFPFFDFAYQGFVTGDLDEDAWAVRYFVSRGIEMMCAQSFSKNFGLYGERVGILTFVVKDVSVIEPIRFHLTSWTRSNYISPPIHGARIVASILNDPISCQQWRGEVKFMADRISSLRVGLRERLEILETPGSWNHITEQRGIFTYLGLSKKAGDKLMDDIHIYHVNGRLNVSGLNASNIDHIAYCINKAVVETQ